ncbi:MAG TPA: metallophosphoesterase, partial [Pyrinomonadaceae bacterium]|nr:metallophosphoesterase [Pyrinomonadaceae bacterium]
MKKWLLRIVTVLALIVLLIAAALGYAYFIEPRRLVVNEATLTIPDFSSGLNGLKIVAISDIHGGSNHVDESRLRELVELANEQSPDLVVLLGDYVAESKGSKRNKQLPDDADKTELRMPVETIADNLKGFQAKYGVYAVIGNHDWWHNQSKVRREFE